MRFPEPPSRVSCQERGNHRLPAHRPSGQSVPSRLGVPEERRGWPHQRLLEAGVARLSTLKAASSIPCNTSQWFSTTEWTLATLPAHKVANNHTQQSGIPVGARGTRARRRKKPNKQVKPPITTKDDDRNSTSLTPILRLLAPLVTWPSIPGGCEDAQILNGLDSAPCHRRHIHRWDSGVRGCGAHVSPRPCDSPLSQPWHPTPFLFCFWNKHPRPPRILGMTFQHGEVTQPQKAQCSSHQKRGWRLEGGPSAIVWSRGVATKMRPRRLSRSWTAMEPKRAHFKIAMASRRRTSTMATTSGNRLLSALIGQASHFRGRSCKLSGRPAPSHLVAGTCCFKNLTHLCVCGCDPRPASSEGHAINRRQGEGDSVVLISPALWVQASESAEPRQPRLQNPATQHTVGVHRQRPTSTN